MGVEAFGIVRRTAAHRHDLAALQKIVSKRDGLIQHAATVVTKIQDVALDTGADLFLQAGHGGFHAAAGVIVESGNLDIADIAFAF